MRQHEAKLAGFIFMLSILPRIEIMSGVSILFQLVRNRERTLTLRTLNM